MPRRLEPRRDNHLLQAPHATYRKTSIENARCGARKARSRGFIYFAIKVFCAAMTFHSPLRFSRMCFKCVLMVPLAGAPGGGLWMCDSSVSKSAMMWFASSRRTRRNFASMWLPTRPKVDMLFSDRSASGNDVAGRIHKLSVGPVVHAVSGTVIVIPRVDEAVYGLLSGGVRFLVGLLPKAER